MLELAMRGFGQIAELTAICEPDVGVITNIGPVHLEQMGSLEGVARAKAELLAGMRDGAIAVVPSDEPLLEPYLREDAGRGHVRPGRRRVLRGRSLRGGTVPDAVPERHVVVAGAERFELELPFDSRHNLLNTLAAVAAARAVGVRPSGRVDVRFGALRGRARRARAAARPSSTTATTPTRSRCAPPWTTSRCRNRRTARRGARRHARARAGRARAPPRDRRVRGAAGVEVLIAVGPRVGGDARRASTARRTRSPTRPRRRRSRASWSRPGDVVLVKASRGVGLEVVAEALAAGEAA